MDEEKIKELVLPIQEYMQEQSVEICIVITKTTIEIMDGVNPVINL
jgi:hypothetical protein